MSGDISISRSSGGCVVPPGQTIARELRWRTSDELMTPANNLRSDREKHQALTMKQMQRTNGNEHVGGLRGRSVDLVEQSVRAETVAVLVQFDVTGDA